MNKKICLSLNSTLECFCCNSSKIRNLLVLVDIRFFCISLEQLLREKKGKQKLIKVCVLLLESRKLNDLASKLLSNPTLHTQSCPHLLTQTELNTHTR